MRNMDGKLKPHHQNLHFGLGTGINKLAAKYMRRIGF
jgi:hypothetical protein